MFCGIKLQMFIGVLLISPDIGFGEILTFPSIPRNVGKFIKYKTLYKIKPTSVYTCAELCIQMPLCKFFNFILEEQLCEIHYGGRVIDMTSSFYVEASQIPSVYGGVCSNHNCSIKEKCSVGESGTPVCHYLGRQCGDPPSIDNAGVSANDLTMGGTALYSCNEHFVLTPMYCFDQMCLRVNTSFSVPWGIKTQITCNPGNDWTPSTFSCSDCFAEANELNSTVNKTVTNKECRSWTTWALSDNATFLDTSAADAGSFCRSPVTGTDADRPYLWCLTDDALMEWDICSIPKCFHEDVSEIIEVNIPTPFAYQHHFADVPISRLTCLEDNSTETTEHCPIARYTNGQWSMPSLSCSDLDCFSHDTPYKGKMTCTVTGRTCQYWNEQTPHSHSIVFSDPEDQNSNYCRTPGGTNSIPWCFTTDPEVRYEYCWIPNC